MMNLPSLPNLKGMVEGALGSNQGRSQFELRIGPFVGGELTVVSFEGHESLNEPFVYDVVFSSSVAEAELQVGIFGFPACLSIQAPDPHEPRVIQGLAVGFESIGAADAELASGTRRFMTRIVPRLWLLKMQRRSRVFQGKSAVQIAKTVLEANGIKADVQVGKDDYPALPFEYQRNETDFEFLRRVLATAGIFFYFRHASGLLDQLLPGAGAAAGDLGALAGAAGALGGAAAGVAGFVSDEESKLGMTTTLVLTDKSDSTEQLGDTSLDAANLLKDPLQAGMASAKNGLTGAATSAFGSIGGSAVGAVAGAVGLTLGQSDSLIYDGNGQAGFTDTERVYVFRLLKELRPKQVMLRSWDVEAASAFRATKASSAVSGGLDLNLTASLDLTGKLSLGAGIAPTLDADALPIAPGEASIFEYQRDVGLQSVEAAKSAGAAERALLQQRADWMTAQGEADCRRIAPGYRFNLKAHPIDRLNREYLVTELRSVAYSPDQLPDPSASDFRTFFRCVPSNADPKPKKPTPPWGYASEAAIVVGPTWGDIHCDSLGRILVRFRWAESTGSTEGDEGVCWVSWLERWGGDGYGTQSLPRVGTEVLVDFHAGGEPIAVGQLRSRQNLPAFLLPNEATKTGVRTRTVPSGAESEISIDDRPAAQRVFIHAAGDFDTKVARNTTAQLDGTYDLVVGEERRESTGGDTTLKFAKNVVSGVSGSLREEVGVDRLEIVLGSKDEYVDGDVSTSVGGRMDTTVQGEQTQTYAADTLERHMGHHTVVVAPSGTAGHASAAVHVEGAARAYAKKKIEVVSLEGLTITCGQSEITIGTDSITISSPTITLVGKTVGVTASDTASVSGKTTTLAGSDSTTVSAAKTLTLAGQSATLVLDSKATVEGSAINLGGSSNSNSNQQQSQPLKITTLQLSDTEGNPLANQRVILRKGGDGGEERVVVLDETGSIDIEGDDPFDIVFPEAPDAKS